MKLKLENRAIAGLTFEGAKQYTVPLAGILKKFSNISKIYILTKQICYGFEKLNHFHQIKKINSDYIIICSRTADHFKHIGYIEKYFSNKIILVEKPLFHKYKNILNQKKLDLRK